MNPIPQAKLNHVFSRHAPDFGVNGPWNPANAALFEKALHDHVSDPGVIVVRGAYRGVQQVTHYYNINSGLNVMVDANGDLVSGWRLSPQQVAHLLTTGNIQ